MSFVQKTNLPMSFVGGLSDKTDSIQLQPPGLLELQNGKFDKIGQINKRYGYDILTTNVMGGGTITQAAAIDNYNNELNLFDNQNIYTYISADNNWVNRGTAISLINTDKQIIRSTTSQQLNPDSAVLNGIEVYVWEDSRGTCRYSVLDTITSAYAIADKQIPASISHPKVIVFNNLIYVLYTSANTLYYRTINTNNPQLISIQTPLIADGYTNFVYDACINNNKLWIHYQSQSNSTILFNIDTNNTQSSSTTVSTSINGGGINIAADSNNNLWCSWVANDGLNIRVFDNTFTQVMAKTIVDTAFAPTVTGIESTNIGVLQLTYQIPNAITYNSQVKTVLIQAVGSSLPGVITQIGNIRSVGLASKAFRYNNNLYVQLAYESPLQSTYFQVLLNNSPFTIVSKVAYQVGGGLRTNNQLPEMNQIQPGIFIWSNLIKGQFLSEANTNFSLLGVNSTKIDFTNPYKFNSVTQSNNLLFVGGILQSYDGVSIVEQNFHIFPESILTNISSTGGSLSVGQYQYQAVYAWSDKFGQIQYSTPSIPITINSLSNSTSVTLTIPTLRLTSKTNVVIKIYRTSVNQLIFREITSELAPLVNDISVNTVSFTDTASDIAIAANATIYTTGGILSNAAPPSCSLISLYQGRVMLSGLEDSNQIWYSKNKFNNSNFNTIPVEFSAQLTIDVPQFGGAITALGLMDEKLIIFKQSCIYILTGSGPNDLGGGDQFPVPELITNSIGCNNQNSVKLIKEGIVFQSTKGIWLLPRGLAEPVYIGGGVDTLGKTYSISSATIDVNDNLIIFNTYNGPALVYDYYIQQWSTWTNHQSVDGIIYNNLYTFAKANGQVYVQNRSKFTDGANPIVLEWTTPWGSFAGLQGYQRVFRAFLLGNFKGPHKLNISVGYDMNPAFTQFATIDATLTAGSNQWGSDGYWGLSTPWGGIYQIYEFQINFKIQKCTSIRLKVSDIQSSNYNEGYTINNLSFEAGVLGDHNRLPVTNKVGAQ